jgi:hypothetical protein
MTIAILMSGRTEFFDRVLDINKSNLIQPLIDHGYTVNFFGSFWEDVETPKCIASYQDYWKVVDVETFTPYVGGVINNFNEHQELIVKYQHTPDHQVTNTLHWLYKLRRAYNLVRQYERVHNMKHDYYIRIRPDASLSKPIDVNQLSQLNDDNIITHVDRIVHTHGKIFGCGEGWIDDNFCIAKQKPFETYCSVYDDLISLCVYCKTSISHLLLKRQFELKNIKTIQPNSPIIIVRKISDEILLYHYFTYQYPDFDPTLYGY